jgi:hypothetical protein
MNVDFFQFVNELFFSPTIPLLHDVNCNFSCNIIDVNENNKNHGTTNNNISTLDACIQTCSRSSLDQFTPWTKANKTQQEIISSTLDQIRLKYKNKDINYDYNIGHDALSSIDNSNSCDCVVVKPCPITNGEKEWKEWVRSKT